MKIDTAILVALISAMVSFLVQLYFKNMEFKRSAKTIQLAILAEISATILIVEKREFCKAFEDIIKSYSTNPSYGYNLSISIPDRIFPVYTNNVDKIGLLDSNKAKQIVIFYTLLNSVIQDVIPGGMLNNEVITEKSDYFKETYSLLTEALSIGRDLTQSD